MSAIRRRAGALAAAALLAVLVAGCSSGSAAPDPASSASAEVEPVAGGTYVHALEADPLGCLDAPQQRFHVALNITRQLADSLVDQDPETGEIVPWLASSWEISDDAQEFTFHLVEGATFADGLPVDAAAVRPTWTASSRSARRRSGAGPWIQGYVGTTVVDPQTVDRRVRPAQRAVPAGAVGLLVRAHLARRHGQDPRGPVHRPLRRAPARSRSSSYTKDQDAVLVKRDRLRLAVQPGDARGRGLPRHAAVHVRARGRRPVRLADLRSGAVRLAGDLAGRGDAHRRRRHPASPRTSRA